VKQLEVIYEQSSSKQQLLPLLLLLLLSTITTTTTTTTATTTTTHRQHKDQWNECSPWVQRGLKQRGVITQDEEDNNHQEIDVG